MKPSHDHNTPFFSVVLTTYNRATLLIKALQSLLKQTEQDWSAIIIDDGSTDETETLMRPFVTSHPQVRYQKQPAQGAVAAKNFGLSLASGRYITFLDSDDEYTPEHLALRKQLLLAHPEIDLLHGGIKVIGNPYVPDRFNMQHSIHLDDCAIGATFFIKRTLLDTLGLFKKLPIGSDADYLERARLQGAQIFKTEQPTYIYHREYANSITHNLSLKSFL